MGLQKFLPKANMWDNYGRNFYHNNYTKMCAKFFLVEIYYFRILEIIFKNFPNE